MFINLSMTSRWKTLKRYESFNRYSIDAEQNCAKNHRSYHHRLTSRKDHRYTVFYKKNWPFPTSFFFIFVFSTVDSKYVHYKILPTTGFELWTSDIRSDCSADWATSTIHPQLHSWSINFEAISIVAPLKVRSLPDSAQYFSATKVTGLGGSPGLGVMGRDSCPKGRGLESWHGMDIFSHIFVVKIVMLFAWKDRK